MDTGVAMAPSIVFFVAFFSFAKQNFTLLIIFSIAMAPNKRVSTLSFLGLSFGNFLVLPLILKTFLMIVYLFIVFLFFFFLWIFVY